jgi:hypothetical protein
VFNDCPSSTVTAVNQYPSLISIQDSELDCFGFANLHVWTLSEDGVNEGVFDNPAHFRLACDFKIEGDGNGEGGLRVSPWWSHYTDGLFNVRSTDGEIACFGGRLPFYTFTGAFGLHYTKGDVIRLEVIYEPHSLSSALPATIEYRVTYKGTSYTSGPLAFDQGNPAEDPPHGLWGMLNDARVGGHFKAFLGQGTPVMAKATFSNIVFSTTPVPKAAVVKERVFDDCPSSTLTTTNSYPALISFHEAELDCFGYANLHVWRFSENGTDPAIFNNNAAFRFASDFKIDGTGNGEGGLQIAPWWSQDADGLFNVRSTDGEIACFGGRLPFYTFTGAFGLHYTKGDVIHLEAIYTPHARMAASPATIEYRARYKGTSYTSGALPFDQGNPAEDPPHTLYGMLNDGRAGGHFKAFLGQGTAVDVQGTFTNITFSTCLNPADVSFDVMPQKLNLKSKGQQVLVVIQPAAPLHASDIDVSSLALNGVPAATNPAPVVAANDSKLLVKFDRAAFIATLSPGAAVPVRLTGEAAGLCIESTAEIAVTAPQMSAPAAGAQLVAGSAADVKWDFDPEVAAVTLVSSVDDGATWTVVAEGVANRGSYRWTVPNTPTSTARLAVVSLYRQDGTELVNQSEYAVSAPFSITSTLGVGDGIAQFGMRIPNPSGSQVHLDFSLPSAAAAELAVFDVVGRRVESRAVGGRPGSQSITLRALPTGLYVVRLTQEGRTVSQRVAIVR